MTEMFLVDLDICLFLLMCHLCDHLVINFVYWNGFASDKDSGSIIVIFLSLHQRDICYNRHLKIEFSIGYCKIYE